MLVFVPGIKGSFLRRPGGRRVWLEASDLLRRQSETLTGPLEPDGVVDAVPLLPCWSPQVYGPFLEWAAEHALLLPFAYDWRRDVRSVSGGLVSRLVSLGESKKRVILVGHSLGALIALHAVKNGGGAHVARLVLVGGPFGGAPSFLRDIVQGDTVGRNRTLLVKESWLEWPSAFQLLPWPGTFFVDEKGAPLALDLDDEATCSAWGLPAALASHAEARRALAAPAQGDIPPSGATLVVASGARPTIERVRVVGRTLDFEGSPRAAGDGRVPLAAARPGMPEFEELVIASEHSKMLNDVQFRNTMLAFMA